MVDLTQFFHSDKSLPSTDKQAVARNIVDTLRSVVDNDDEIQSVLNVLVKLSKDPESQVRAEVMEQVLNIAIFCNNVKHLNYVIIEYLVPMIVQYFSDPIENVRKTSQAALLVLIQQGLLRNDVIEEKICPLIFQLIERDNQDNYRTEGVALMIKLALLVGKELTMKLLLERFSNMCRDSLYLVRRVCAANFGDFCCIVGVEVTEEDLIWLFYSLCEDTVWEVRKACSEVFMTVACACSLKIRKQQLAAKFVNLLCDNSRWVKVAAFQSLGPFISTFAKPYTGLIYQDEEAVYVMDSENREDERTDEDEVEETDNIDKTEIEQPGTPAVEIIEDKTSDQPSEEKEEPDPKDENQVLEEPDPKEEIKSLEEFDKKDDDDNKVLEEPDQNEKDEEKVLEEEAPEQSNQEPTAEPCSTQSKEEETKTVITLESNDDTPPAPPQMDLSEKAEIPENVVFNPLNEKGDEESIEERIAANIGGAEASHNSCANPAFCDNQSDESLESFETFNYWRVPIPEIELNNDFSVGKDDDDDDDVPELTSDFNYSSISARSGCEFSLLNDSPAFNIYYADSNQRYKSGHFETDSAIGLSPSGISSPVNDAVNHQDIVPKDLLYSFINMTDPNYITIVDTDITRHCAYSIPAVAFTLGKDHWPCIKSTYESLSSDIQWKVRHTLASSIHELAKILGQDIASKDLVPIFNDFIKDLDEVRIGILRNLGIFLKLLDPEIRRDYLPKLAEFIKTDNIQNWRFRHELAHQLLTVPKLYTPTEVKEYIVPIALCLVNDKVAEVRKKASKAMAVVLNHVVPCQDLIVPIFNDLTNQFCRSSRWLRRQTFAVLCLAIIDHVPLKLFYSELFSHLLQLCWDPVANVRIAVARCISFGILKDDYFENEQCEHHDFMMEALNVLRDELDCDVFFFSNMKNCNKFVAKHYSTVLPV